MKFRKRYIFILLFVIFLIFCIRYSDNEYKEYLTHVDEHGNYWINDKYYLSLFSAYSTHLDGPVRIDAYVEWIGWNDEYIVALRRDRKKFEIDYNTEYYYIIELNDDTLIGPLDKKEYKKYSCSSIKLRRSDKYVSKW